MIPSTFSECQQIAEYFNLGVYHDGKWGFVIYRCAYGDNERWAKFMKRLTEFVDVSLPKFSNADSIKDSFAWTIQDDRNVFEGASKDTIRTHFKQWVQDVGGLSVCTKYAYCIYADEEVIEAILEGDGPDPSWRTIGSRPIAYVKMLDSEYQEDAEDNFMLGASRYEPGTSSNEGGEAFPPIEGCRKQNVGWMKVAADSLVPRAYSVMLNERWDLMYKRPPPISDN